MPSPVEDLPVDFTLPANLQQPGAINQGNLLAGIKTEVDAEIQSQVDPLQAAIDQYMTQSGRAVSDLNTLYGNHLEPAARESADRLASIYDQGIESERQIQAAAAGRLQQLHAQRATDAQKLAQEIGGPVPLEMFVNPVDIEQSLFTKEAQGSLIYSGMLRDAGVQQAEAFSGRVLPLLRAEQTQAARNYFRDKRTELEKEINTIKGMRKGMIDSRLRERMVQEREYKLQKLQADRDAFFSTKTGELESWRLAEQARSTNLADANTDADRALDTKKLAEQRKANATQYDDTVKQNLVALVNGAFTGGKPQNIYRLIQDPNTLEYKSVQETVSSPGGVNPQTGQPWQNKQEVINWVFSQVGVSRNNKAFRAFVQGKIDLLWPKFATERNKAAGAQQRFDANLRMASQMEGWDSPVVQAEWAKVPDADRARWLSEWIQKQRTKFKQQARAGYSDGNEPKVVKDPLYGRDPKTARARGYTR